MFKSRKLKNVRITKGKRVCMTKDEHCIIVDVNIFCFSSVLHLFI